MGFYYGVESGKTGRCYINQWEWVWSFLDVEGGGITEHHGPFLLAIHQQPNKLIPLYTAIQKPLILTNILGPGLKVTHHNFNKVIPARFAHAVHEENNRLDAHEPKHQFLDPFVQQVGGVYVTAGEELEPTGEIYFELF